MKKIISALLICMLAAVCLFTGCSKAKGLKVKDSSGNDREVNDETKTLCGEDAKFTEIKVSANGKEAFIVSALFEKNGVTYTCTYKTSKAGANTGDFESIVNSISFR